MGLGVSREMGRGRGEAWRVDVEVGLRRAVYANIGDFDGCKREYQNAGYDFPRH